MKKFTCAFLAAVICAGTLSAQNIDPRFGRPANEVNLTYGRISVPAFAYTLGGVFGTVFTLGAIAPEKMVSSGAISFEYYRYVHEHVAVGAATTYEVYTLGFKSYTGKDEEGHATYNSQIPDHTHIISIMPAAKFPWFNYEHVGMYSKAAVGLNIMHTQGHSVVNDKGEQDVTEPSTSVNVAWQANPVCVDFGNMFCRGFVELGWGFQGLVMLGLRYSF